MEYFEEGLEPFKGVGVWGELYSGSDFSSGRLYSGRPEDQGYVEVRVVLR